MKVTVPDIAKNIEFEEASKILENRYKDLNPLWVNHQHQWIVGIYDMFKDVEKSMILQFLFNKTMQFYSLNFVKIDYDEFYNMDFVKIDKVNMIEISKTLDIPKESTRRKIAELEKAGAIFKKKKELFISRKIFSAIKPQDSITRVSRFLSAFSRILQEEKIINKSDILKTDHIEACIKKNFSYCWKLYYDMQIPMLLSWKKIFKDLETWIIWGTCIVNQALNQANTENNNLDKKKYLNEIFDIHRSKGINAMSISDITGIPRATVIRKLNQLVKNKFLNLNEKKHYKLSDQHRKLITSNQKIVLNNLANFSAKVLNLSSVMEKKNYKDKEFEVPFYLKSL